MDRESPRRRRILVSAYGCEPDKGSEQGVGWNWCIELAKANTLIVITRANNRLAIESAIDAPSSDRIRFVYYDLPKVLLSFKRRDHGLYFYYLLWQIGAYTRAKRILRENPIDYVIHLTFGSMWLPTLMHRLGVPFIWGPIGGGEAVPPALLRCLPMRARCLQWIRSLLIATSGVNPFVTSVAKRAAVILARTDDTRRSIPRAYVDKVRVVLETAMPDRLLVAPLDDAARLNTGVVRVIYTGRLVPLKNVSAAVQAVARAKQRGASLQLVIVGDGPSRQGLEKLARLLGIQSDVRFLGALPQSTVIDELARSDIYLFPSLKEGGVWSLMEAMLAALPVICLNSSGMATITSETCAIRVAPSSPEEVIEQFAEALVRLASSRALRKSIGATGRERILKQFRWESKGEFLAEVFGELEQTSK
jgi:glycosyltransferase involved in cell wall biosynthesis